MKMDKVASSKNDEFYTPAYAVKAIISHLKLKGYKNIWCPFDTQDSNFVKILKNEGFVVRNTHLNEGCDFFETKPPKNCHAIVSNPPYSKKTEVLERLFSLGVPFAMLLGVVGVFESKRRVDMFSSNTFEVLYLDKRVAYFKDFADPKPSISPPFQSAYFCSRILEKQILFARIDKTDW